jgi:exoribonuclease-2
MERSPFYSQEAPQLSEVVRLDVPGQQTPLSVQFARRRGMRSGMLGPSPGAHRGLGLPFYAQVTSPLRRYQDLLAHMQIRSVLALGSTPPAGLMVMGSDEVSRRCAAAGAASAPNRQAERDSNSHWTAVWLSRNPGWTGEGIAVQSMGPDVLCYLPALGLETRVRNRRGLAPDDRAILSLVRVGIPSRDIVFELQ